MTIFRHEDCDIIIINIIKIVKYNVMKGYYLG